MCSVACWKVHTQLPAVSVLALLLSRTGRKQVNCRTAVEGHGLVAAAPPPPCHGLKSCLAAAAPHAPLLMHRMAVMGTGLVGRAGGAPRDDE